MGEPPEATDGSALAELSARVAEAESRLTALGSLASSVLQPLAKRAAGAEAAARQTQIGFLGTASLPVGASKIRNSLFVTEPLRSPVHTAMNVLMREDVAKMQEEAIAHGAADRVEQLRAKFL